MALFDLIKTAFDTPHSVIPNAESGSQKNPTESTDDLLGRWRKVVDLYPNDHKAVLTLCDVLNELRQYEEADKHLAQLVENFPTERAVMYAAARQHMRRRRDQKALTAWTEIDKCWPDNVEPLQNIGALMIRCGQVEQSLDIARQLAPLDPDRSERLFIRAYRKLEEYEKLLNMVKQVSTRRDLDADEYAAKAVALAHIEGHDAAIDWSVSARDAFPKHAGIAIELASLLSCQEQHSQALAVLETHANAMNDAHLHAARRATLLVKLGRLDEADTCAEHALTKDPDDKDLLLAYARIAQARFAATREAA